MEEKNHTFRFTALFVLTAKIFAAAAPLRSRAGKQREETIRIPLKLCDKSDSSPQGWKVVRFEKIPPNKTTSDEEGLHIRIQSSANLLAWKISPHRAPHLTESHRTLSGFFYITVGFIVELLSLR